MASPIAKISAIAMGAVVVIAVAAMTFMTAGREVEPSAPVEDVVEAPVVVEVEEEQPKRTPPITPSTRRAAVKTAFPIDRDPVTKVPRKAPHGMDEEESTD